MQNIFAALTILAFVGLIVVFAIFGTGSGGGVNGDIKSTSTATHTAITNVNTDITTLP